MRPLFRLFILEAKKPLASQTEIDELEHQVYGACLTRLKYAERDYMYAMTTIGTKARLWVAHRDEDYLIPWIPSGTTLADKSSYIEAHSSIGSEIEDGWTYMKKNPKMSRSRLAKLRETLRADVESKQPSTNKSSDIPGSASDLDHGSNTQHSPSSASTSSYPAFNQPASGFNNIDSEISYTLPIVQDSSTYRSGGFDLTGSASGSGNIVLGDASESGRISSPSEGVEEHHPLIPENAIFVNLEVDSNEVYYFYIGKDYYEKGIRD